MGTKRSGKAPSESVEITVVMSILRARHRVAAALQAAFDNSRVTGPQYRVLRALRHAGATGLSQIEISQAIPTSKPNVTGLLKRLEAAGLVERRVSQRDNRVKYVTLTRKGQSLAQRLEPAVERTLRDLLSPLNQTERRKIIDLLDRILPRAHEDGLNY